jgi:hypothetical protein
MSQMTQPSALDSKASPSISSFVVQESLSTTFSYGNRSGIVMKFLMLIFMEQGGVLKRSCQG